MILSSYRLTSRVLQLTKIGSFASYAQAMLGGSSPRSVPSKVMLSRSIIIIPQQQERTCVVTASALSATYASTQGCERSLMCSGLALAAPFTGACRCMLARSMLGTHKTKRRCALPTVKAPPGRWPSSLDRRKTRRDRAKHFRSFKSSSIAYIVVQRLSLIFPDGLLL